MSQLSPKQARIYEFILSFTEENGYPPSVREIAEAVGLKSPSTVHFHLKLSLIHISEPPRPLYLAYAGV